MIDLSKWLEGEYRVSEPIDLGENADDKQGPRGEVP